MANAADKINTTNNFSKEDIEHAKEKLRKLLAMQNSNSPAEAEIAAKRVNELLEKFNLKIHSLCVEEKIEEFARAEKWTRILSSTIGWLYGTQCIRTSRKEYGHTPSETYSFIGDELYAFLAKEMYQYLYDSINRTWRTKGKKVKEIISISNQLNGNLI